MGKSPPRKRGYEEIDESLRRAFDEVVSEGVPDRFSDLLSRLKAGERPASSSQEDQE